MGKIDVEAKKYLSNNEIFADAFNFLLYNGEEIIKADKLEELDTTEFSIPFGNKERKPVQKYRDIMKIWNAMMDDNAIYVILGAEIQDKVHYGMPVKDGLYDMLGYSKQIEEKRRSYRRKDNELRDEGGALVSDDGVLKIKLTSEEFLSGLRKGDKLRPIITAVIYLGEEAWDGPRCLFDMLDVKDKRLYNYLSDYKLNIISPADIEDEDFDKFHSELGFVMRLIKHQSDDVKAIIGDTDNRLFSTDTAYFLKSTINLDLEYDEDEGGVDMCKGLEKSFKEERVKGAIEGMRIANMSEKDVINNIIQNFDVTEEYVLGIIEQEKES